jgi:glycosyltransferase involved in cell wall biosynthesis
MKLRLLVVGLDPAVLDPASASAARQSSYLKGYQGDIVVLVPGAATEVRLEESVRVFRPGGSGAVMIWNAFRLLRRLRREGKYDVATVQEPAVCGTLVRVSRAAKRFHVQDHSAMFARPHRGLAVRWLYLLSRFNTRRADRIRTVSERGRKGLIKIGVPSEMVDVVPVPTNIVFFRTAKHLAGDHPRLLTVARLFREKGIDILLRSFAWVVQKHPDATLTVIGDGPERSGLERLAADLCLTSSISFVGTKNADEIRRALEYTDVYVQPSRFEGWGIAVIEAAAAGVPVVMTDVGCAGELILEGRSGRVVPVEDPAHLCEAIVQTIEDPDQAKVLAAEAKRIVEALPTVEASVAAVRTSLETAARSH